MTREMHGATVADGNTRDLVRRSLRLEDFHRAVLVLPPIARETGAFISAWAVMLLEKIRPDARLIVPGIGREPQRVERLIAACSHEHMARFTRDRWTAEQLILASDATLYLPPDAEPVVSVLAVLALGRPIIASAVGAIPALLADRPGTWLCRANDPKDACRCLLAAIERP